MSTGVDILPPLIYVTLVYTEKLKTYSSSILKYFLHIFIRKILTS